MRVNPGSVGHRPRTGSIPGRYDTFLDPIEMYLETHTIPGAGIALSVPGDSILTSGMGWESLDRRIPVEPESLFRIASLSKPLTAAAVRILVDTSDITLDSPVLQYLDVEPTTGVPADPRFADITIRHLLTHRGGWNRRETSDPMLAPRVVVGELGIELPPSERDIARYLLGRDLAFTPGTETAYANVGYLLLGILIEDVSGQGYQEFVRESVLDRAGVDPLNHGLAGRSRRTVRVGKSRMSPIVTAGMSPDGIVSFVLPARTGDSCSNRWLPTVAISRQPARTPGSLPHSISMDAHTKGFPPRGRLLEPSQEALRLRFVLAPTWGQWFSVTVGRTGCENC